MKNIIRSFVLLLLTSTVVYGQRDIAIGDWRAYVSFNEFFDVTQSEKYVYAASERGILKIKKDDLSLEKITKVEGLSDTEPRNLKFDINSETLVINYINGNIDLLTNEGILNIPNIFSNANIRVSKEPNHTRLDDESNVYIAYDFGLVQINLPTATFGFSLLTDFEIYDFVKLDDRYYFSSEDGIYWADANPNLNHADLSTWTRFESGWPFDYFSKSIAAINGRLYAGVDGDLVEIVNDLPIVRQAAVQNYFLRNISVLNSSIGVSFEYNPNLPFRVDELFFLDENATQITAYRQQFCVIQVHSVVQDQTGQVFYANGNSLKYLENVALGTPCSEITAFGPNNTDAFEIAVRDQEILVAAGEISNVGIPIENRNGIYSYEDGLWDQFNHKDGFFGDSVRTYVDIDVGPNNELAIGTFFKGVILQSADGSMVQLLNNFNSCIESQALLIRSSVTEVRYDDRGQLWLSNYRAETPLKVIDRDGVCREVPISRQFRSTELDEIAIDDRGWKWISTTDPTVGVIVYDDGDFEDPGDDRFEIINTSNSVLSDNVISDIVADLDGDVWVGSEAGVVVFECGGAIFSTGCSGRRPIVEVDGVAALLLENERIRAIAVDGANRKWFGTSNGIFVQSPNGEDEILRFDERNSPLISNLIRDISINQTTGEVFIATDKGLMSYRTDATLGDELVHAPESEVFAFPNPVRPEYDGPIAIKGLPRDARVKITDIQGKLIFEGEANGGEAIWNGRDYNGRKASSGVYLVFSTSQSAFEKPDALVSKILVVK